MRNNKLNTNPKNNKSGDNNKSTKNSANNFISNKTIFLLLGIALVITIAGTAFNVAKLLNFGSWSVLTGAASTVVGGNASVTIQSQTKVTNVGNATVAFGSGYVNGSGSCSVCRMDSNGTVDNDTCCVSFNRLNTGFLLENTGNENVSVNWSCSGNCTGASFIGTSGELEIKVTANSVAVQSGELGATDSSTSCGGVEGTGAGSFPNGAWNITNGSTSATRYPMVTYVGLTDTASSGWLCGNTTHYPLESADARDAAVVDVNVTIVAGTGGSGYGSTAKFTFTALSSG